MSNNLGELSYSHQKYEEYQKKQIREIYVARKKELDVANALDHLLEEELGIEGVSTEIYIRYLTNGLTDAEYKTALPTIFGELPVEDLMDVHEFSSKAGEQDIVTGTYKNTLNIESLPGQYDDVVDSTQQCLMLQTGNQDHQVRAFTTITFHGEISDEDMAKVKKYLINPVDKQHIDISDRIFLRDLPSPENVKILDGFTDLDTI